MRKSSDAIIYLFNVYHIEKKKESTEKTLNYFVKC